jgi:hypothetical protein
MKLLLELQRCEIRRPEAVLGFGSLFPIFGPPPNYQPRLPRTAQDNFTSGVIQHAGLRIGFIRIPVFAPADPVAAIEQFRSEILYFEANTDGLIVDEMRNPGGIVGYVNALLQMLFPYEFRTIGFEIRATSNWVQQIGIALENARAQGAPPHIIALFEQIRDDIVTANSENRGRTGPLPLDTGTLDRQPATDAMGRTTVYTKPLMVVIDEASASAADMFPATIQDNNRGILFGMRTMGAGGSVVSLNAGNYTEGFTSLTQTLMSRKAPVSVPGYPTVPYIENVGVHPDIVQDYMTRENLMQNGQPFVTAVLDAMAEHIRRSR